jgi:predicted DCC family thiol-disulfide oxidoreductase YuxK
VNKNAPESPVLYFDGACPVCAREIAHYRQQAGSESIVWVNAATCSPELLGSDLSRADALARLHLRRPDGSLVSGAAAFVGIWQHLPRWAWLARCFRSGLALHALDLAYRAFLKVRPLWRREVKRPAPPAAQQEGQ